MGVTFKGLLTQCTDFDCCVGVCVVSSGRHLSTHTSLDLYMNAHIPSYAFGQYTQRESMHLNLCHFGESLLQI